MKSIKFFNDLKITSLCLFFLSPLSANNLLSNGSFEQGLQEWNAQDDAEMSRVGHEGAYQGKAVLEVNDLSDKSGSSLVSPMFKAKPKQVFELSYMSKILSGKGIAVYLKFYDAQGKHLNPTPPFNDYIEVPVTKEWLPSKKKMTSPENTVGVNVWIHSYGKDKVSALLDALVLEDGLVLSAGDPIETIRNGDFEDALSGWNQESDNGMSVFSKESAYGGQYGLRVNDDSEKAGSSLISSPILVKGNTTLLLTWFSRVVGGAGIAIYHRFYDAEGKLIPQDNSTAMHLVSGNKWKENQAEISVPPNAATADLWIHSYMKDKVVADFDQFSVKEIDTSVVTSRWPPQYKIYPAEKSKLTDADVVGPDGIVYPNWSHVGVRGGIPQLLGDKSIVVTKETDIAEVLEREAASLKKGGVITIPAGTYYLSRPISIYESGVVIRGAGKDKTRLVFNYQVPKGKVYFQDFKSGDTVGLDSSLMVQGHPEGLTNLTVSSEGFVVAQSTYHANHWGLTFSVRVSGADVISKCGVGDHKIHVRLNYRSGEVVEDSILLRAVNEHQGKEVSYYPAAIAFIGKWRDSSEETNILKKDGLRGDKKLTLAAGHGYLVGDKLRLMAPTSPRWNELVKNAAPWGTYRENLYEVTSVDGNVIGISEPLRLEFPVVDGSFVQKVYPIERCGVEDLTLEQTENIWTSGIVFTSSWNSWLKNVAVIKTGRFPFYFPLGKYGEVRDCEFHDAWWKGGGGTAYVGFERSYDCLLDNVKASDLRHAPNLNWAASGCVFRNFIAEGSDGQWHCGWANENLFENVTIHSGTNGGGYGFGLFSTSPEDAAHGPIGPRNVVYHCDITSPKDGLILNGMNEGWIFAYNRFVIERGKAVSARETSFDHLFYQNTFVIKNLIGPAFLLEGRSCSGWELSGNLFYGVKAEQMLGGSGKPFLLKDNQAFEYAEAERPKPVVPSIFEWQKANVN